MNEDLSLEKAIVSHIKRVLRKLGYDMRNSAIALKIARSTLYRYVYNYDLRPPDPERSRRAKLARETIRKKQDQQNKGEDYE